MTDPLNQPQTGATKTGGFGGRLRRTAQFIVRNPGRSAQFVFFLLIAIIILQNLETTSIDVLFWSIAALPKLVLIFLSMVIGAVAWELMRRLKR
jgi:uncharacterized integral membrane protein